MSINGNTTRFEINCPYCGDLVFSEGTWDTAQCKCGSLVLVGDSGVIKVTRTTRTKEEAETFWKSLGEVLKNV